MSKTKEELNALKEEINKVNEKICELTPEELEQVTGGQGYTLKGNTLTWWAVGTSIIAANIEN